MKNRFLPFLLASFVAMECLAQVPLNPAQIKLHLSFENSVADQSDANATVSEDKGTITYTNGVRGMAADFDGASALTVGNDGWFNTNSNFSLAVWVNLDAWTPASAYTVAHQKDGDDAGRVPLDFLANGNVGSNLDGPGKRANLTSDLSTGNWYHIAEVFDRVNGEAKLYLDGALVGTFALSITEDAETSDQPWSIGANKGQAGAFFNGLMDELIITTELLSEDQVKTLAATSYNNGAWVKGVPDATKLGVISDDLVVSGSLTARGLEVLVGNSVTIQSDALLDIKEALLVEGSVIVESGGSFLSYDGQTAGAVTIHRTRSVADGRYSMVGIPVTTANGADLGSSQFIFSYDEETNAFLDATTAMLMPGQGYATAADQSLSFTGVPNTGTITYDATQDGQGYNLVANPYAAAISVSAFLGANTTSGTIYLWNDGGSEAGQRPQTDYLTANASGLDNAGTGTSGSAYNGFIGSAQGFFVQVTGGQTITFSENMRDAGNNADANYFRKANSKPAHVKLSLRAPMGDRKVTTLAWATDASDFSLNIFYDSKPFNAHSDLLLYTVKDNTPLVIQGVTSTLEEIALGVNLDQEGQYSLALDFASANQTLYLRDNATGEVANLSEGSYTFSGSAGQFSDRFTILMSPAKVLSNQLMLKDVYVANNTLFVNREAASTFRIYSLSGQMMKQFTSQGKGEFHLDGMRRGVYIVTDGQLSTKFILD